MEREQAIQIRDRISRCVLEHDYTKGPLLVLAGPGTGKTYSLLETIKTQLEKQFEYHDFFEATLTNAAADDFIKDAKEQITPEFDSSSTLHHRAKGVLHQHAGLLNLDPGFTIVDEKCEKIILKDICYMLKNIDADEELKRYKEARAKCLPIESDFCSIYQKMLTFYTAVDWFDIVKNSCELLENYKEVRNMECDKFKFLLVDEYQDLNVAEQKFVELLLNKRTRLLAVGDDDQSIYYSFRYADSAGITKFRDRYPSAKKVVLSVTTRLPSKVIDASYSLIANNRNRDTSKGDRLIPLSKTDQRANGGFVVSVNLKSGKAERKFIGEAIYKLINGEARIPSNKILILCNWRALGIELIESIQNSEYKIAIQNDLEKTDDNESEWIFQCVRGFIANQEDNLSLRIILSKLLEGNPNDACLLIKHSLRERVSLWETIKTREVTSRLKSTSIIIEEFLRVVEKALEFEGRKDQLDYILSEISPLNYLLELLEGQDKGSNDITAGSEDIQKEEGVRFLTLHSSKGLDADYVFIPFMEESLGLCGFDIEEERRLLYVAITRAKVGVIFSWAWSRHSNTRFKCGGSGGKAKRRKPSPFIRECEINPYLGYHNDRPSPSEKAISILLRHADCVHCFDAGQEKSSRE